jgi:hypothetical protein
LNARAGAFTTEAQRRGERRGIGQEGDLNKEIKEIKETENKKEMEF